MFGLITGSLLFAGGIVFGGVVASRTKTNQQHLCDEGEYCCDICGHYVNESDIKWLASDFGVCTECRVNMTDREIHDFLYVENSDQYEKLRATLKKRVRARRGPGVDAEPLLITMDGIIYEKEANAKVLLNQLNQLIEEYGVASVADLCELMGISTLYFYSSGYGWDETIDRKIIQARVGEDYEGYKLPLPLPRKIR